MQYHNYVCSISEETARIGPYFRKKILTFKYEFDLEIVESKHHYFVFFRNSKFEIQIQRSFEKICVMLIFDVSHMTKKIWRCSIFEVDHAISFKNMI